jgi:hypothetical protein
MSRVDLDMFPMDLSTFQQMSSATLSEVQGAFLIAADAVSQLKDVIASGVPEQQPATCEISRCDW